MAACLHGPPVLDPCALACAPPQVRIESQFPNGAKSLLVLYTAPTRPGHAKHMGCQVLTAGPDGKLPPGVRAPRGQGAEGWVGQVQLSNLASFVRMAWGWAWEGAAPGCSHCPLTPLTQTFHACCPCPTAGLLCDAHAHLAAARAGVSGDGSGPHSGGPQVLMFTDTSCHNHMRM